MLSKAQERANRLWRYSNVCFVPIADIREMTFR
jgi:hypothetical protein